jgi:Flp pilus assembly protein TadD
MPVDGDPLNREQRLVGEIAQAMRSGDIARASELADLALAKGVSHALPYQARAVRLDTLGRGEEALRHFEMARVLAPGDPMVVNGVALCLGRMGRLAESMAAFRDALMLDPNFATTHFHRGMVLEIHGDFGAACGAYRRAVELAPGYAVAWAGLATAAHSRQAWKEAGMAAARSLALDPRQPRLAIPLAFAKIQEGAFETAEMILREALRRPGSMPRHLRGAALGLLADALDGQGKSGEAFACYTAQNRERRAGYVRPRGAPDMAALVRDLTAFVERTPIVGTADPQGTGKHAFLLGFPRSGTTLLEQVLAAHSAVVTLEESDVLDATAEEFLCDPSGFDRLAALGGDELLRAREQYWRKVHAHGIELKGNVLVDKLPLNTIKLPLIAKLFPQARILFCVRDPRAVVFSCFRRALPVNASTVELLTLEGAAKFYDGVMSLAEICRSRLPLAFHVLRLEDLVRDFEGQTRTLCAFLDIEWTDGLRDFAHPAQDRNIRSISASQVRRGLYGEGADDWKHYARELTPILPLLRPWVESFGYESR